MFAFYLKKTVHKVNLFNRVCLAIKINIIQNNADNSFQIPNKFCSAGGQGIKLNRNIIMYAYYGSYHAFSFNAIQRLTHLLTVIIIVKFYGKQDILSSIY